MRIVRHKLPFTLFQSRLRPAFFTPTKIHTTFFHFLNFIMSVGRKLQAMLQLLVQSNMLLNNRNFNFWKTTPLRFGRGSTKTHKKKHFGPFVRRVSLRVDCRNSKHNKDLHNQSYFNPVFHCFFFLLLLFFLQKLIFFEKKMFGIHEPIWWRRRRRSILPPKQVKNVINCCNNFFIIAEEIKWNQFCYKIKKIIFILYLWLSYWKYFLMFYWTTFQALQTSLPCFQIVSLGQIYILCGFWEGNNFSVKLCQFWYHLQSAC